jgi:hypothetical protein
MYLNLPLFVFFIAVRFGNGAPYDKRLAQSSTRLKRETEKQNKDDEAFIRQR